MSDELRQSRQQTPSSDASDEASATLARPAALLGGESPRGAESVFSHIGAENAPVYRAILRTFATARQGFVLHLRPVDVSRGLPADAPAISDALLGRALDQLCEWKNLERQPDTSEVTTIEAFYRPRYFYRLTPRGEAAERALAHFAELLDQRGELQVAALTDIRAELEEIVRLCAAKEADAPIVYSSLERVFNRLESLTRRAQSFLGSLQRGFDPSSVLDDADVEAFKELVVSYLERFVGELLAVGPRIARLVDAADLAGIDRLLELAAQRELADALEPSAADQRAVRAGWSRRWQGLQRWFLGEAGQPSQSELLRAQARKAIIGLLSAVKLLHDRRQRRSDRSADLVALAGWFAEASDEADCHRLWRAAFGLSPARHLGTDAEALAQQDERGENAQTSWLDATPITISPRLRKSGRYRRRGRREVMIDRSIEKAALLAQLRAERVQLEAAREALCTDGETTLSVLGALDRGSFDLLLDLLGAAVAKPRGGNDVLTAMSTDGALQVVLTPLENGAQAQIETRDGTLRCRDFGVRIIAVDDDLGLRP